MGYQKFLHPLGVQQVTSQKSSVSYSVLSRDPPKEGWVRRARQSFFWYDTDSGNLGTFLNDATHMNNMQKLLTPAIPLTFQT